MLQLNKKELLQLDRLLYLIASTTAWGLTIQEIAKLVNLAPYQAWQETKEANPQKLIEIEQQLNYLIRQGLVAKVVEEKTYYISTIEAALVHQQAGFEKWYLNKLAEEEQQAKQLVYWRQKVKRIEILSICCFLLLLLILGIQIYMQLGLSSI